MTRGLVIAIVALLTTITSAQVRVVRYGDDRLTGIREVDVLVTAGSSAPSCATSVAAVQRRAVEALRRANVKATVSDKGRSWFHSIVIDIRSERSDDQCASAIAAELVAEVAGIPEVDRDAPDGTWGSLLVGAMPLVRDTALVIRPALEHDAAVQATVETQVASIASRIRSANP